MKNFLIVLLILLSLPHITAQKKAITETGDEVILYDDGTWMWMYSNSNQDTEVKELVLNSKEFKKGTDATFLLKSAKVKTGLWLNTKKWSFSKANNNKQAEYKIVKKDGDVYGLVINEKVEIPLESLKNIVLKNAKNAAPDAVITHEEYRMVNGNKVMQLDIIGTIQGIKFAYFGYYYSNAKGTTQLLTYTSQNLMKEYRSDCEELLNGLVEID